MPRITATDHKGRFRMTHLNPGVWEVYVMKRLLDKDPMGLSESMRMGPLMESETQVWSGETSYLDINLDSQELGPTGTISGKVRIDGAPAHGARLSLYASKRFEATVDSTGSYNLGRIPVGQHTLKISNLPGRTGLYDVDIWRSLEVMENQSLFEDFEILTGNLSGQVIYESDGSPVRDVKVSANIEGDNNPYQVRIKSVTGVDGKFLLEGVPIGSYTVKGEDRSLGCTPVSGIKVFPGGRAGPVVISMIDPVWVRGRVEIPKELKGKRWMGLIVSPADAEKTQWQWIKMDKDTGVFETNQLIPGPYKARLVGDFSEQYEFMELFVPQGGVSNLLLVPSKKQ